MKLFISYLVISLLSLPAFSQTIPLEQRVQDFNYIIDILDEYYPYWWLKDTSPEKLATTYLPRIVESGDDSEAHYLLLNEIVSNLADSHTHVTSSNSEYLVNPGFEVSEQDNRYFVTSVSKNSYPANRGVKVGMEITQINGLRPATYLQKYTKLINGSPQWKHKHATSILPNIAINRKNGEIETKSFLFSYKDSSTEISITLETLNDEFLYARTPQGWGTKSRSLNEKVINKRIGYIAITSFGRITANANISDLVEKALISFNSKKLTELIVDLRGSIGGSLDDTIKTTSFFQPEKTLVARTCAESSDTCIVKNRSDVQLDEEVLTQFSSTQFKGKVIIITDALCRSACELFAGFMKVNKRATVIGQNTAGAGGALGSTSLPSNDMTGLNARISLSKKPMYLISDGYHETKGVAPDYKITSSISDLKRGIDTLLHHAIELLKE